MIRYKNNNLRRIPDGFLEYNEHLEVLEANNVKTIGNNCLRLNDCIKELHLRNTYEIGENFLFFNRTIQKAIFPRSFVVNDGFFGWNQDPNSKPLRIENNDINIMKYNDIHSEGLLQSFVSALKRRFYNLYNYFVDDREMDFTDDGITISKIEKNNAFTALKKLLINKKLTEKELEAVEDISEITKGM